MKNDLLEAVEKFRDPKGSSYGWRGNGVEYRSQSKLVNAMLQVDYYCGVEENVLSEVMKGKRLFTPPQLEAFCKVLRLTAEQRYVLEEAFVKAYEKAQRYCSIAPADIDYAKETRQLIRQARIEGNHLAAIMLSKPLNNWALSKAPPLGFLKLFHPIRAEACFELAEVEIERSSRQLVLTNTSPFIEGIRKIAKDCQDEQLAGLAHLIEGATYYVYYIGKECKKTVKPLKRALAILQKPDFLLYALRVSVLVASHQGEFDSIKQMAKQIDEVAKMDGVSLNYVCTAYEGLAQAYIQLKFPEFFPAIEKAIENGWNAYDQLVSGGKSAPLVDMQMVRTSLLDLVTLQPTNKLSFERFGMEKLRLIEQYGDKYRRHPAQIRFLLNLYLN
jgi:hypothetical protein